MRNFIFGIAVASSFSSAAIAQDYSGDYLCVVDQSAGIAYDERWSRWTSTTFDVVGDRFTLRVEKLDAEQEFAEWTPYSIQVAENGYSRFCSGFNYNVVNLHDLGYGGCGVDGFFEYRLNLATFRFSRYYMVGFINGKDEVGNTPSVSVGTCSRF